MLLFSWHAIGADGPPVRGDPNVFQDLASAYANLNGAIQDLDERLRSVRFGTTSDFRGAAADAFAMHIARLSEPLSILPATALDLSSIFQHHQLELKRLQQQASSAFARAQTLWTDKQDAESDKTRHSRRLASISSQLDCLDASEEYRRDSLLADQEYNTTELNDAIGRQRAADSALEGVVDDWHDVRERETVLNEQSASRIRHLELGALSDPGFWERVAEFFDNIIEWRGAFVDYLFSMDFLEDIYNSLGVILIVLSVVAIVALVVFSGGTLALALAPWIFGLACVKATIGCALYADGRISGTELALDLVGVAVAGVGWHTGRLLNLSRGTQSTARVVTSVIDGGAWLSSGVLTTVAIRWEQTSDFEGFRSLEHLYRVALVTNPVLAPVILVDVGRHGEESSHFLFEPSHSVLDDYWKPMPSGEPGERPVLAACRLED